MKFKYLVDSNLNIITELDDTTGFDRIHHYVMSESETDKLIDYAKKVTFEPVLEAKVQYEIEQDSDYLYDYVELGLNINVPAGRIEMIRYYVELMQDNIPRKSLIIDGFPKDKITERQKFKGTVEVQLGVSSLLRLIPFKIGETLNDLISLDVKFDPIEIGWMESVLDIGFSGPNSSTFDWWVNGKRINIQNFKCSFIVRRDRYAKELTARVHALHIYDPSIFRRAFGRMTEKVEYPLYPKPGPFKII